MSNLYVIDGVLNDYQYGSCVIIAKSLDEAREIYIEALKSHKRFKEEDFDVAHSNGEIECFALAESTESRLVNFTEGSM